MTVDINFIVGEQTPTVLGTDDSAVYFNELVGSSWVFRRVVLKYAKQYQSLDELLEDRTLIPENKEGYTKAQLNRYIAIDGGRGFGVEYPEQAIMAYAGRSVTDKPIAKVKLPAGFVFYANPSIKNLVKRI